MAQTVALGASLGASKTGLLIGYRLLNLDETLQAAFTLTNVVERTNVPGDYFVTVPVNISDDGAIVIWGISGTDYRQYTIDPVQPMTLADGSITTAKFADNAITDAKVASDVTIASVTGAVGSVTGNVGGNVVGSVASVAAGVTLANNAVTAAAVASDAVTEIQSGLATATNVSDAQTAITTAIAALPGTAAIVTAIMAYAVETGHSLDAVMKAIYAGIRGKSVADDADDPTEVVYYAPDNSTVRFTHTLTDTERTVA